ncbi:MAG: methyltransferase domain-containing protein [Chloroflexi bacterium]|nr:methyltransferase domain-containing protein [Chloroflexota bacterium]
MARTQREIIEEYFRRGDFTGWFEAIYQNADGNPLAVPWARMSPHPDLMAWLSRQQAVAGKTALVVGCGLGDDAEALSAHGYDVTAFDISAEAIRWCVQRFQDSRATYAAHDLFAMPAELRRRFDFVLESNTLQSLPWQLNASAVEHIAGTVAAQGMLMVLCLGRDPHEARRGIPWPQSRDELDQFVQHGLQERSFEDLRDDGFRRFRAIYRAPDRDSG